MIKFSSFAGIHRSLQRRRISITQESDQRNLSAFEKLSSSVDQATAKPVSFTVACLVVFTWLLSGPIFGFSDTWQLVINTGTTIITFLMMFLYQNAQARQAERQRELLMLLLTLVQHEEAELKMLADQSASA